MRRPIARAPAAQEDWSLESAVVSVVTLGGERVDPLLSDETEVDLELIQRFSGKHRAAAVTAERERSEVTTEDAIVVDFVDDEGAV